jgi:hypothetical protein
MAIVNKAFERFAAIERPVGIGRGAGAGIAALAFMLGLFVADPAAAQSRGSQSDQQACTPDVFRLCSADIPDEKRIVACLVRSRAQLSPACRTVFAEPPRHGPATRKARKSRPGTKTTRTARHGKPMRITSEKKQHRKTRVD